MKMTASLKIIICAAAGLTAAFTTWHIYNRWKTRKSNDNQSDLGTCHTEYKDTLPLDSQLPDDFQQSDVSPNSMPQTFPVEVIQANAAVFSGAYEPLYKAVNSKDSYDNEKEGIIQDWLIRLKSIQGGEKIISWINNAANNDASLLPTVLLNQILMSGIQRDNSIEIVADKDTKNFYVDYYGQEIKEGENLTVGSAAWSYNDVCIEKGITIKI